MNKLTEKQAKILGYIKESLYKNGYQPSTVEIRDAFGFQSTNAVHSHLRLIADKGYIQLSGKARAIKILR